MKKGISVALSLALAISACAVCPVAALAEDDLAGSKITVLLPKHEMDTIGFY